MTGGKGCLEIQEPEIERPEIEEVSHLGPGKGTDDLERVTVEQNSDKEPWDCTHIAASKAYWMQKQEWISHPYPVRHTKGSRRLFACHVLPGTWFLRDAPDFLVR
jgi:hypothetical protein